MASNSFGEIFSVTTFGESHGKAIGCVIDGCPSLLEICENDIQKELDRRRPGQSNIFTSRNEADKVQILSGIFSGKTTGTPICLLIENGDQHSDDYNEIKDIFRPGHADFTYFMKYGIRDYRGGGRSSARETACRVAAGAIAKKFLREQLGIEILAYTHSVGEISCDYDYEKITFENIAKNITRCPDEAVNSAMVELIEQLTSEGNSVGGSVRCLVKNCPVGLGEPLYDKLSARLASAMFSINAVKGFEIGEGCGSASLTGAENNDEFYVENGVVRTKTNHCGGILGGISNGQTIDFMTYFKPVATIKMEQNTIYSNTTNSNTINSNFENVKLQIKKGRHDPCVVPRAVPVVEAMTAIVLMDMYLKNNCYGRK